MKPISVSEKMLYNTVRLETRKGRGTGSFFNFKIDESIIPVIITNKHVVNHNENEEVTFFLHTKDESGEPSGNIKITYCTKWYFHKSQDLCFCFINPLIEKIKDELGKDVFYISNDESIIYNDEKLKELNALEELVMVGYPIGIFDEKNNFPIFRKGYTASHPAYDFNNKGIALADIACFPGSSGSPVYILNEGGYKDKHNTTYLGSTRVVLLGYLFAGPVYNANGKLLIKEIPTQQVAMTETPLMINLGYYIKASEILWFKQIIEQIIK